MAARGLDRRHEIDLRRALGAGAHDIAALVLAEAGLLATAGTLLGLALTIPLLHIALALLPVELALLKIPAIDVRVVLFTAAVTLVTVAGVSVWPIRRGLRAMGTRTLAGTSRGIVRVRSAGRFVVVSTQIAIGLALTLGGALLVGSIVRLRGDDIGIDARGVYAVELRVPASATNNRPGGAEGVLMRVLEGVRTIPGVSMAGATDALVLSRVLWGDAGWKAPAGAAAARLNFNVHGITSGFFDVVRPRLLAGRLPFTEELDAGRPVVVVSETIAKSFWPNRSAVGETLEYDPDGVRVVPFSVVGVVADARYHAWDDDRFHQIYAPVTALRRGSGWPHILIRTDSGGRVLAAMEPFLRAEGADVRAIRAMPLDAMFAETVRHRRFQSWLFGSFAAAALTIVGAGILGLTTMTAARRTREIGLRMALGATKESVLRLFVREQLTAVVVGLAIGGLVSAWAAKFLQTYLYGITYYDPRVWMIAVLLVAATATAGALVPALRACRIDPAVALRLD
jgi:predicted permease